MRPRSLHDLIQRTEQDGHWDHHLREFLDTFYAADGNAALQASFIEATTDMLGQSDPDVSYHRGVLRLPLAYPVRPTGEPDRDEQT